MIVGYRPFPWMCPRCGRPDIMIKPTSNPDDPQEIEVRCLTEECGETWITSGEPIDDSVKNLNKELYNLRTAHGQIVEELVERIESLTGKRYTYRELHFLVGVLTGTAETLKWRLIAVENNLPSSKEVVHAEQEEDSRTCEIASS